MVWLTFLIGQIDFPGQVVSEPLSNLGLRPVHPHLILTLKVCNAPPKK